jgi:hypothetical protein
VGDRCHGLEVRPHRREMERRFARLSFAKLSADCNGPGAGCSSPATTDADNSAWL